VSSHLVGNSVKSLDFLSRNVYDSDEEQMMTEWMTVREACVYLKVDRRTLYKYMKLGKLPYYQLGGMGTRRFRCEDLDGLLVPKGGKQKTAQAEV